MLDQEWIELMAEAKHLGLTVEEIKEFLSKSTENEQTSKTGWSYADDPRFLFALKRKRLLIGLIWDLLHLYMKVFTF